MSPMYRMKSFSLLNRFRTRYSSSMSKYGQRRAVVYLTVLAPTKCRWVPSYPDHSWANIYYTLQRQHTIHRWMRPSSNWITLMEHVTELAQWVLISCTWDELVFQETYMMENKFYFIGSKNSTVKRRRVYSGEAQSVGNAPVLKKRWVR